MRIKILRGVNVQTANGVSPASAGAVVEVTARCGLLLCADGRAELAPEGEEVVKVEDREKSVRKRMSKR
jgi:hypothetical protein